jgi:sulfur carrier protein ThiS|tara:strand:- start:81 stop:293 length:213 start_codon:yes stop_codon:yes gene_type:complete
MGPLVDYLPESQLGQTTLTLSNEATVADLLNELNIKRKVVVAVNDDEEKELDHQLIDGDEVLVFTVISGG